METNLIDALAQEIRRVDGNHTLGAGALAEALAPFVRSLTPDPAVNVGAVEPLEPAVRYEWDGIAGKMRYFGSSAPNGWLGDETPTTNRVADLVWESHPNAFPSPLWSAQNAFGFYNIEEVSGSDSPLYEVRLHAHHLIAVKDGLPEAKGVAQSDYERRILSALTPPQSGKAGGAETPAEATPAPSTDVVGEPVGEIVAASTPAAELLYGRDVRFFEAMRTLPVGTKLYAAVATEGSADSDTRKSYSFIGNDCPPGYRRVGTIDVADPADVHSAQDNGYRIGTIYDGYSGSCAEPCAADIYERPDEEPFPQPSRKDGEEPCGECHIQPGETCDICGAVNPAPQPNLLVRLASALEDILPWAEEKWANPDAISEIVNARECLRAALATEGSTDA